MNVKVEPSSVLETTPESLAVDHLRISNKLLISLCRPIDLCMLTFYDYERLELLKCVASAPTSTYNRRKILKKATRTTPMAITVTRPRNLKVGLSSYVKVSSQQQD
jgi:hypothetical protein